MQLLRLVRSAARAVKEEGEAVGRITQSSFMGTVLLAIVQSARMGGSLAV